MREVIDIGSPGDVNVDSHPKAYETLNRLGEEGWELVQIVGPFSTWKEAPSDHLPDGETAFNIDECHHFYFKRPKSL